MYFEIPNQILFCGIIFLASYSSAMVAQETGQSSPELVSEKRPSHQLVIEGSLLKSGSEASSGSTYSLSLKLPALDINSKYEIILKISNPYDDEIAFAKAVPNCVCSSVEFERNIFPPNKSTSVKIHLKTPQSDYSGKVSVQIGMYSDPECQKPVAHIGISGELQGSLAFVGKQAGFQVVRDQTTYNLAFRFTHPIELGRLETIKSQSLKNVSSKLIPGSDAGEAMLQLSLNPNDMQLDQNIVGDLTVRDRHLNIEDTCSVVFMKRPPVVLSPEEFRFRPKKDEQGKPATDYVAKFILRIDEENLVGNRDKKILGEVSIRCFLDGKELSVLFQKLGSTERVYRGEVYLAKESDETSESTDRLKWEIVSENGERFNLTTFFYKDKLK